MIWSSSSFEIPRRGEIFGEHSYLEKDERDEAREKKREREREKKIKPLIRRAQKQRGNNVMHRC